MIYVTITLIVVALVLFTMSFFMNDKFKQLEEEIEQVSISSMQDTYQLKKKMKIFEEELLSDNLSEASATVTDEPTDHSLKPLLIQKVIHLHHQGYSDDEIARQTDLSKLDVYAILKNNK